MADARVRRRVGVEIGDDALGEILARVRGLRDLLRCAATCKRWCRLVTDRDFLRRRPLFDCARPLAARRGYLLTRVLPSFSADVSYGDNHRRRQKLHLAVCRPLLDKTSTHLLPPPPFDMTDYLDRGLKGCAILTAADHTRWDGNLVDHMSPPKFQVLLIYNDHLNGFVCASAYRSDTPRGWSTPVKCCPAFGLSRYGPCTGVIAHGSVHWLFKDEIANQIYALYISADTSHVSMTKIQTNVSDIITSPIPCVAGEEGGFPFVTIERNGVAHLWTKQDQDNGSHDQGVWQCSELAKLGSKRIDLVFFAESRGALLVEQGGAFSTVDLKSKLNMPVYLKDERPEHLRGTRWFPTDSCSSTCCRTCYRTHCGGACEFTPPVLYEMDWAFISLSSHVGDHINSRLINTI
uniref:F-box domain-containing protein n=1 Tax=Aegilops tauschii TaxID=37682 RepID=M8CNQ2_AEGTA